MIPRDSRTSGAGRVPLALAALLVGLATLAPSVGATSGEDSGSDATPALTTVVTTSQSEDGSSRTMTVAVEVGSNPGSTSTQGAEGTERVPDTQVIPHSQIPQARARWGSASPSEVQLSWKSPRRRPSAYQVNWKRQGEEYRSDIELDGSEPLPYWDRATGNVVTGDASITLDRLAPGGTYNIRIRALFAHPAGDVYGLSGDWLEFHPIRLYGDPNAIAWVDSSVEELRTVDLEWGPPANAPTHYYIRWKKAAADWPLMTNFVWSDGLWRWITNNFDLTGSQDFLLVDATMLSAAITGLDHDTDYNLRIMALYRDRSSRSVVQGPWHHVDFTTLPNPYEEWVRELDPRCGETESAQQYRCGVRKIIYYWGYPRPDGQPLGVDLGWREASSSSRPPLDSYTVSRRTRSLLREEWSDWKELETVDIGDSLLYRHQITPVACGYSEYQIRPNYTNYEIPGYRGEEIPTRGLLSTVAYPYQGPCRGS
ncbi:fibronectin type III domain-containing protein [Candidatus Poriferisodalis sp.]|uniref:fibronectin type III domain-containing protein n=1 Tax=Candidatus Poriferisodalis sp. TaxID=3101277 RepID=UPI003B018F31